MPHFTRWGDDEDDEEEQEEPGQSLAKRKVQQLPASTALVGATVSTNLPERAAGSNREQAPAPGRAPPAEARPHQRAYGSASGQKEDAGERITLGRTLASHSTHMTRRLQKKKELLAAIDRKKNLLADVRQPEADRPASTTCSQALEAVGGKPYTGRGARPCWRPGTQLQLATLHCLPTADEGIDSGKEMKLILHTFEQAARAT